MHASNACNGQQVILHENRFKGVCAHNVRNTSQIHTVTQKRPDQIIAIPILDARQVEQRLLEAYYRCMLQLWFKCHKTQNKVVSTNTTTCLTKKQQAHGFIES